MLQLPWNYVSNTPINGTVVARNTTVADLGVSNTTYTFGGGQTITIQVAGAPPGP